MIEQLGIENFQSHEESILDFCPGVNTIIGTSNNGKSATVRGLRWLLFNKPNGIGFVSHWNLTDKGTLKKATRVWVKLSGEIGIARYRTKDENGYKIGEKKLEAIGQDLPEEVARLLNLTDVNFQNQLDAHFLLSESAGEVARFFNRTIRLDIIDTILAAVESKKRKNKAEAEALALTVKGYSEERAALEWIETADSYLAKAEALDEKLKGMRRDRDALISTAEEYDDNNLRSRSIDTTEAEAALTEIDSAILAKREAEKARDALKDSLEVYDAHQVSIDAFQGVGEAALLLTEIELVMEGLEEQKDQLEDLETDLLLYEKAEATLAKVESLPDIDDYLTKIEEKQKTIKADREAITILRGSLREYEEEEQTVQESAEAITELEAQLPDLCPMCGNPWDGADHDHKEAK